MCCKWVFRKLVILKKKEKQDVHMSTTRSELLKSIRKPFPAYPSTNRLYVLNQFQETNIGMNQCFHGKKHEKLFRNSLLSVVLARGHRIQHTIFSSMGSMNRMGIIVHCKYPMARCKMYQTLMQKRFRL